ncbi:MAG: hypothetical protein ABH823_00890 [bacterium]
MVMVLVFGLLFGFGAQPVNAVEPDNGSGSWLNNMVGKEVSLYFGGGKDIIWSARLIKIEDQGLLVNGVEGWGGLEKEDELFVPFGHLVYVTKTKKPK